MRISPGERVEIVVDFSGDAGNSIDLLSYASELVNIFPTYPALLRDKMDTSDFKIMSFLIGAATSTPVLSIPTALTTIPLYNPNTATNVNNPRLFLISNVGLNATINGATMQMSVINEYIQLGDMEIWEIINSSGVAHPFHIHGSPFQVIARSDGPVPDNEKGWKDVILIAGRTQNSNSWVKIIKPHLDFADSITPYMYHCHILEHEDRGMMGQYVVVDTPSTTTVIKKINSSIENTKLFPNPVSDNQIIHIEFSTSISDNYSLVLLNQNGQVLKTYFKNKSINLGTHQFHLNTEGITAGVYFLSISSNQSQSIKKLIKIN